MVKKYILAVVTLALLAGCDKYDFSRTSTLEVKVPVATRGKPPAELTAPVAAVLPNFIAPSDKDATSALSPKGEADLRILIGTLLARIDAWNDWAGVER